MYLYTEEKHPTTGWPRTIMYEQNIVPHVIADLPISPPGSPREEGDEDDYIPEYDMEYNIVGIFDWRMDNTRIETFYRTNQYFSFQKNYRRKNNSKNMRRIGKLKQPGGSSCNQRR